MKPVITCMLLWAAMSAKGQFVAPPYLQVGENPTANSLHLLWHAAITDTIWKAEYNTSNKWISAETISHTTIALPGREAFTLYNTGFNALMPGTTFNYRILKNGKQVFAANAVAPKTAAQPFRFIATGDMGAGTKEAVQIAKQMYNAKPDLLAVAGDIVYDYGLVAEYKTKFWPIYNAEPADSAKGAALMRSVPFIAAVGNHDADTRDLDKYPDALAYYLFWNLPLNGPAGNEGGPFVPMLKGKEENVNAFKNGAGSRYPRMTNYSFNYGNAHWTVIDADTYVDWTDSTLIKWVAADLAASKLATWKFVLFHHPGFNSAKEHFEQQQMRLLAPVFEKGNVDIVFNGHVHNYQRSYPLYFKPAGKGMLLAGGKDNKTPKGRVVTGTWKLDKDFNGKTILQPDGVIYLVTGAGGQELYNPEQEKDPDSWQKFTCKFISTIHSFTVADVNGKKLTIRQVDANGNEVDVFTIVKQW